MASKRFGYGRVSTVDQNLDSQKDALESSTVDEVFIDVLSGTKSNRPALALLVSKLREGDTVVITRLDRLGRSAKDLLNLVSDFEAKKVRLEVIEQQINTATAEGRLFFTLVAAFAEFERSIMQSRTIDGLAAARARGRVGGRPAKMTVDRVAQAKRLYDEGKPVQEIANLFGVSRPTVYRALES